MRQPQIIEARFLKVGDIYGDTYDGRCKVTSVTDVAPDELYPTGSIRFTARYARKVEGKRDWSWRFHKDQTIEVLR